MKHKSMMLILGAFFIVSAFLSMGHNGKEILSTIYFVLAGLTFLYAIFLADKVSKLSIEKELLKNKELFDKGILTEDEYNEKMSKLKVKI